MASIPDRPAPGEAPAPGQQRHDYEVGAPLRDGWGGTLREGRYRRTGLRVTVQDIRTELTRTPGLVERLAGIGRSAPGLRDPHLLAVYDLVEGEGALQLIAEWSEAPTLAASLRRGEIDERTAVVVVDGILAGLQSLHGAGLFHGRVGSDTMVVDQGGVARLAELAICAAAAPPGAGPEADVRAAARLGLELLRGSGRRLEPVRRALEAALAAAAPPGAAALRAAVADAAASVFGAGWRELGGAPARPRRRRWRPALAALVAVLAIAAGIVAGIALFAGGHGRTTPPGPLTIGSGAALTVTPASGGCNTTFVFVARGAVSGSGILVYRWEQSDGESTASTSLPITLNDGAFQLTQAWRLQGAQSLDGSMTLHILSPVNRTFTRPFHYVCA
ncbi:MAG TPA: hypothetical protein VH498_00205 [Candidatus Dormibacteraeota bacterium]|nr:hypothetical protein [Candidatus Dormibacteraeota bacterium]